MIFHQLGVRIAGSARHACGEYLPEQRFLRHDVSPSGSCKVKVAVFRQKHQIELGWSVGADRHRLKARLFIPVGEGDNRVGVREIVVEW
jgi:hypothetical protein